MQNLSLIIFLIIRIFSNPFANVLQKRLSCEIKPSVINFYSYLLLSVSYLPFINKYISADLFTIQFTSLVLFAGLLCTLGTVCLIKAINIGELSVLGPINSYKSIIGLILAFIFLKEIPSFYAIIGIFLIILGSKMIFDTEKEGFSLRLFKRKDIQLRFLALIFTATEAVVLKKIILLSSIDTCFVLWCFTGMFWSFVFLMFSKERIKIDYKQNLFPLMLISLCLGFMQYSTNFLFKYMNVGYALALFQLSTIVTVFFGYKFFNGKELIRKLLASVIMIIGSVIIILF